MPIFLGSLIDSYVLEKHPQTLSPFRWQKFRPVVTKAACCNGYQILPFDFNFVLIKTQKDDKIISMNWESDCILLKKQRRLKERREREREQTKKKSRGEVEREEKEETGTNG